MIAKRRSSQPGSAMMLIATVKPIARAISSAFSFTPTLARQVLRGRLRGDGAIAAPVERPRAAEDTIPRAAACELRRGARVQHPDEVLPPPSRQVACRPEPIEVVENRRRRTRAVGRHHP